MQPYLPCQITGAMMAKITSDPLTSPHIAFYKVNTQIFLD